MIKNILAILGLIDILFTLYLNFAYVGYGDLGEFYFNFGQQYLMIGVIKQWSEAYYVGLDSINWKKVFIAQLLTGKVAMILPAVAVNIQVHSGANIVVKLLGDK